MDIDLNSSRYFIGINSKICKTMLDKSPAEFCHLFANSLLAGKSYGSLNTLRY